MGDKMNSIWLLCTRPSLKIIYYSSILILYMYNFHNMLVHEFFAVNNYLETEMFTFHEHKERNSNSNILWKFWKFFEKLHLNGFPSDVPFGYTSEFVCLGAVKWLPRRV